MPSIIAPTPQEVSAARATIARDLDVIHATIDALLVTASKGLRSRKRRASIELACGLTDTVKQLALGFAGMFTARAAFHFVKDTVAEASALKDLAQQTHINVEELQMLAGAMSEFGVDADTLGKGLFTLSRKIAGGDESVEKALGKMGMSLKDVDGLNGEALFLKIMSGLSKLQGGLRDDTSSEIFGSRLGMAMAGASEGIEGAMATWRQFNTVMSTETVDALDETDEAIKRAQKSLASFAGNTIGHAVMEVETLNAAVSNGMGGWEFWTAKLKDWGAQITGTGSGTEHLARLLDQLNQKTDAASVKGKEYTEVLIDHNVTQSAAARAWNAVAKGIDDAANSSVIYGDGLPVEAQGAMTSAVKASSDAEAAYRLDLKFTSDALDQREAALRAIAEAATAAKAANDAFMNAPTLNDRNNAPTASDLPSLTGFALDNVLSRFHQAGETDPAQALQRALAELSSKQGKYAPKNNLDYFNMLTDQALLAQLRNLQLSGDVPGFAGGVTNFSGGMAMVGERGPEMVRLPRGADVIPTHQLGGSTVIHLTVDARGRSKNDGRSIGRDIVNELRNSGVFLPAGAGA